jgi:hypothetical protein
MVNAYELGEVSWEIRNAGTGTLVQFDRDEVLSQDFRSRLRQGVRSDY